MRYRVSFVIDVEAESAEQAISRAILMDPSLMDCEAVCFDLTDLPKEPYGQADHDHTMKLCAEAGRPR